jgi:hypothetical protein
LPHLTEETFKKNWDGAVRTLNDLAKAFREWFEHCKKGAKIAGSYAKKN